MNQQTSQAAVGFSAEDHELLSYLLAEEGFDSLPQQSISRREGLRQAPLSYGQQRLWFLYQLQPLLPVYNNTSAVRLQGKLNVAALQQTLSEIVRRHDTVRTTFAMGETQPVQVIQEQQEVHFSFINLMHLPRNERDQEAQRLCTEAARRPFDLAIGPLLRSIVLRVSDEEHIAVLVVHHIISDGWSMQVLINELTTLYAAFTAGHPAPLSELLVNYIDYAVWQRESLTEELLAPKLAYWRKQLAGAPRFLEFPTDRPRPPVQSYRGANEGLILSNSLVAELRSLSLREGVTLFMTMLAVFLILLSRYTQQTDLTVGTPIAGRGRQELEKLIGFFANTLVLRADLSGDPRFLEVLAQVKKLVLDAHAQEVPFEKLLDTLQPERSLNYQPVFQVMFALENASSTGLDLKGMRLGSYVVENGTSRFDLTLSLGETTERMTGTMEYSTDLFDGTTATRIVKSYENLLHSIVANPAERISRLDFLTREDKDKLLLEWNTAIPERPRATSLSRIFEEQVERTAEAVALSFENEQLTYDDLNRRANQVAHYLRKQGTTSGSLVGLCLERSLELVVALLGILKAGGAYVPLDPAYPKERLAFMLTDAQIGIVITQQSLLDPLPVHSAQMVCLDRDWEEIGRESEHNLISEATPDDLAYIIYTSGSTGVPKGVAVTHGNVLRLFAATRESYGFNQRDVWTFFHSFAFDFSVWEVWGALLHGGRLVIVPHVLSRTPDALYQLLLDEGVTVLNQTPSAFNQLMRAEESEGSDKRLALRFIIFGGEALNFASLLRWYERHDERQPQLVNMYGITEATVHVTYRSLHAADAQEGAASMIGRPIPDLQVYILDEYAELVPVGVPGELYLGGDGLARGYLNRPDLTADRFVPHAFSTTPGTRMYRSGDRARYRHDGDMEYLGRIDDQVKVHGFRIELGEIEAILGQHEALKEVVVTAREDVPGDNRLVAYFVAKNSDVLVSNLRNYLKERLPEYMIPSAFVSVAQVPLTANGKIDRRALPAPGVARPELTQAYTEPTNEIEEVIAAIWANALHLERVGIHDNFFELGGDSILCVRVLAMARERGINFSLQQLFQYQTVAALAQQVNGFGLESAPLQDEGPFSLINEADRAKLPPDVEDAYPLAMLQAGMLYHMAYSPGRMIYHNVYSHHMRARLDSEAFRAAVRRVVARHPILRTSFDLTAYSEPLQLVHKDAAFPVTVDDLRQLASEEQERVIDEFIESEKRLPFDYARPPLVRFHLHRRTENSFNFTLTECHPILDGWSLHSLIAEIFTSYFASINGKSAHYPPVSSSYREFVRRERQELLSEGGRLYWQEKLRDMQPTDLPRWPAIPSRTDVPRILRLNYVLTDDTSKGLKNLARSLGLPVKSVLLAAHLKVLSVICGRTDVVTGLVSSGRLEETDGDKSIGLFFNTLPFHAHLGSGSWKELIQAIFRAELEMLPYRRYPIAALQREWGRKPLFESVFNYLHFHVLDDLAQSGDLELLGPTKYWEETNLTLSTAFMLPLLSEQIVLTLRFDTTQFGETQIEAISGYYLRVLDAMVADADQRHDRQLLLSEDELQKLLVKWSGAAPEQVETQCIHQVFEAQVDRRPEAIAIVHENEHLTYRQLNERANCVAEELRRRGVGPDVPVVVYLKRSSETVLSMLAVLKAGGAYVPMEPGQPPQRTALMLAEIASPVLLTRRKLIDDFPASGMTVLCLDDYHGDSKFAQPNLATDVSPENLAYLIFTSGSTGTPKAVGVEHRQLLNYTRGISRRLALGNDANYALASTFTTDLGHTAIFPALLSGGALHVLSTERLANARALAEYFNCHRIDFLKIVPSHLEALLRTLPAREILPQWTLVLGGDVCRPEVVAKIQRLAPDCAVFNHYGPTETTVGVLTYAIESAPEENSAGSVPLGRPLPGARIFVLDASLNPVPIATPGEIYIGGEGVARGYFNQPSLTAQSFVPDPLSNNAGARLYKSGDMGRYLPDGNIIFLGRHDHQIKVRGYRIELREIEVALGRHSAVTRAVAVVDHDHSNGHRIIAYVVANTTQPPSQAELRRHLREHLPEYAVPADFVLLEELPLTAAGKVDRKSLPSPVAGKTSETYIAPRNEMEETIAAVWREFLRLDRMSIHDNFFDAGGHSLVLLQVRSKLSDVLQREISITTMFEYPTISSLAQHLIASAPQPSTFLKLRGDAAARKESLARRSRISTPIL